MPKLRGSITPRGKRFYLSFPLPAHLDERDSDGNRLYRKLKGEPPYPDKESALARLVEINHQYNTGTLAQPDRQLLRDYLNEWLATKDHLAYNSQALYRSDCDLISAHIGGYELRHIDTLVIQRWHAQMRQDDSVSTAAANRAHRRLSQALKAAVNADRIPVNYASRTPAPKHRSQRHDAWEPHEARAFVAWISEPSNVANLRVLGAAYWMTLLYTGLRLSEGLALRWSDLNLPPSGPGSVSVERTAAYVDAGVWAVKDEPKTDASVRAVPIPASVVALLRTHRADQNEQRLKLGRHWHDDDLVWTRWDGTLVTLSSTRNQWRQLCRRAGLRRIPIHGLRATFASLMHAEGVSVVAVQEMLGHRDVGTTLGIYTRSSEQGKREASARLDAVLRGVH